MSVSVKFPLLVPNSALDTSAVPTQSISIFHPLKHATPWYTSLLPYTNPNSPLPINLTPPTHNSLPPFLPTFTRMIQGGCVTTFTVLHFPLFSLRKTVVSFVAFCFLLQTESC